MYKTGGIIIEGGEQQFKTSFCLELSKRLNLPIVHYTRNYGSNNEGEFDYANGYFIDIDRYKTGIIFDRNYVSELVYGKYFNRNNITNDIKNKIESEFNKLNYFLVLLQREQFNWINRDEYISEKQNYKIIELYNEVFNLLKIEKYKIDPSNFASSIELVALIWETKNVI